MTTIMGNAVLAHSKTLYSLTFVKHFYTDAKHYDFRAVIYLQLLMCSLSGLGLGTKKARYELQCNGVNFCQLQKCFL